MYGFMDGYQLIVYVAALACLLACRRGRYDEMVVLMTSVFFTGFGCYLLWEAKSIYMVPFFAALIPMSAVGLASIYRRIDTLRTKKGILPRARTHE